MTEKENVLNSGARLLLFITPAACQERRLAAKTKEGQRLELCSKELGLKKDLVLNVSDSEEGCYIMLMTGPEAGHRTWMAEGREPVRMGMFLREWLMVMATCRKEKMIPGYKFYPSLEQTVCVGSSYKNQIFYDFSALVKPVHLSFYCGKEGYLLKNPGEGVYVNGKKAAEQQLIKAGERVWVYGLQILLLEDLLVCIPHWGCCRTAGGRRSSGGAYDGITEHHPIRYSVKDSIKQVERSWQEEEMLHQGEYEMIAPVMPAPSPPGSLWISLGPSFTMLLPMLFMAFLGSRVMGGGNFYYLTAAMSACSCFLTLFWGVTNRIYQKRQARAGEKGREAQYREYLWKTRMELAAWQQENRQAMERKYPALPCFLGNQDQAGTALWNRYPPQRDFLFLRIGTGNIPFQVRLKLSDRSKTILPNKLLQEARELICEFSQLKDAPVGIDLYESRALGILGSSDFEGAYGILLQLLLQIAACHSCVEIKTAVFYDREDRRQQKLAECLRWMPHLWNAGKKRRFLAGNEQEAAEILPVLTQELKKAEENAGEKEKIPWFVVILLTQELIRGEPLYQYLTKPQDEKHVSTVFVGEKREQLPKCCRSIINGTQEKQELIVCGEETVVRYSLRLETGRLDQGEAYLRNMAGVCTGQMEEEHRLPSQISFLQLFACQRVEELDCLARWRKGNPAERLKVPLGTGDRGECVFLDVHEKFHGPHGLIAGTTGAGKSELLQTYLLSLAVSFSPRDINFFLIDYKGGGTGNEISRLPHCAGVISNLSGKQIKRAMSAITSENKRRQRILGACGVNHIDRYRELYGGREGKEPMPHLILVVDEFAELKKEEPEFMTEIISLAQVGRSLGVHLLLATQKPAGTVDERIWSNARFRLCLKVQDRQDSMDMLHRPEAASLSAPGQCYFQIGSNEYFQLFQSAYCGSAYDPTGKKEQAFLVTNTGRRYGENSRETAGGNGMAEEIATAKPGKENRRETELQAIISYVNREAKKSGYESAKSLWVPELPQMLFYGDGLAYEKGQSLPKEPAFVLGICDDPENQRQEPVWYFPTAQGHLAVLGGPGTGKSAFIQNILWQLCVKRSCREAVFLIVDRKGSLGCFAAMPHCLGMLREWEEKDRFFYQLERQLDKRKETLAGLSWQQYQRTGQGILPVIFVVIDDLGNLLEGLKEAQERLLLRLAAEGIGSGLYLIVSAASPGEIKGKLHEKIRNTFALELSDKFLYGEALRQYSIPVLPKENVKGRGLCRFEGRILEFQTMLPFQAEDEGERMECIRSYGKQKTKELTEQKEILPEKFPVIPDRPVMESVLKNFLERKEAKGIPLGYVLATGELAILSLTKKTRLLIGGLEHTGRRNLLHCLEAGAEALGKKTAWHGEYPPDISLGKTTQFLKDRESIRQWQQEREQEKDIDNWCFLISNLGLFIKILYQEGEQRLWEFWEKEAGEEGKMPFMAGVCHSREEYEITGTGFFRQLAAYQQWIHLGGNIAEQRLLSFEDLDYQCQTRWEEPGIGYYREGRGGRTQKLRLPFYEGDQDDSCGH